MITKMLHVGFGHYVNADAIVAVAANSSAPIKHSVQEARDKREIIDLTSGRRTKSVIFTGSRYVVLAALEPATINGRLAE